MLFFSFFLESVLRLLALAFVDLDFESIVLCCEEGDMLCCLGFRIREEEAAAFENGNGSGMEWNGKGEYVGGGSHVILTLPT